MPDDKNQTRPQDAKRINVNEDYEPRDWSKKRTGGARNRSRPLGRRIDCLCQLGFDELQRFFRIPPTGQGIGCDQLMHQHNYPKLNLV